MLEKIEHRFIQLIIELAVSWLPVFYRSHYREEWRSFLNEFATPQQKIFQAFGLLYAAGKMRFILLEQSRSAPAGRRQFEPREPFNTEINTSSRGGGMENIERILAGLIILALLTLLILIAFPVSRPNASSSPEIKSDKLTIISKSGALQLPSTIKIKDKLAENSKNTIKHKKHRKRSRRD